MKLTVLDLRCLKPPDAILLSDPQILLGSEVTCGWVTVLVATNERANATRCGKQTSRGWKEQMAL